MPEEILDNYRTAFSAFSEEELAILDGVISQGGDAVDSLFDPDGVIVAYPVYERYELSNLAGVNHRRHLRSTYPLGTAKM